MAIEITPGKSARGQRRRADLLDALEQLLEDTPLAAIQIDDIARRAGITRSGFYFYFPTKAAAVAALVDDVLQGMLSVSAEWFEREDADHEGRVRAGVTAVAGYWREHAPLITAMFDAAATDPEVATIWDSLLARLKQSVAARMERDRELGLSGQTLATAPLAAVLIDMTAYAMERDARGGPTAGVVESLVHVWDRAMY